MVDQAQKAAARTRRGTTKVGVVVAAAMDKTVTIKVVTPVEHPKYQRIVRRTAKFMAHDPQNRCKMGDTVEISESRPLSKRKRWRVLRIVRAAKKIKTAEKSARQEARA
jgi:small subunit ribosomal protein S17